MASENALQTGQSILGADLLQGQWKPYVRMPLSDVPQNDEGIRMYARNGDWASAMALAEQLEEQVVSGTAPRGARLAPIDSGDGVAGAPTALPCESRQTAALTARLPYVLVRVSALVQMQRYAGAKRLLDELGDMQSERYLHPVTKAHLIPFSLRFLSALLPHYCGGSMDAQGRLYTLLAECESRLAETTPAGAGAVSLSLPERALPEKSAGQRRLWLQRAKRVQRALVTVHYSMNQFALAIHLFQRMLDLSEWESRSDPSLPSQLRYALMLQQYACLCLHCGHVCLAQQAFRQVENAVDTHSSSSAAHRLHRHIVEMNECFSLVFFGRFREAAERFQAMAAHLEDGKHSTMTEPEDEDLRLLCTAALDQVRTSAQVSHLTCLPYAFGEGGGDPERSLPDAIELIGTYVNRNPIGLCHSDAFLGDALRFYSLNGTRKVALAQMTHLLEVFRCESASIPDLERMI